MPAADLQNDVSYPIDDYRAMEKYWEKIDALKGGTESMREAGQTFLPKEEAESKKAYDVRLNRTFLYEGYNDTINRIVSKPFSRNMEITGLDDYGKLLQVQADVDRTGKDINSWAAEVFESAVDRGLTHVLVDYPELPPDATLETEKTARPTWVHVPAESLIGWRYIGLGDNAILTQIRIHECRKEPDGDFGDQDVEYVRVITPFDFQIYRKAQADDGWIPQYTDEEGNPEPQEHTFGAIPLFTMYTNRTGFLQGIPALNGLANLNIEHWQSSSDQRVVLTMSRFGILFGKGFTQKQIDDGLEIGPKRFIGMEDTDGDLKFVEHTGAAITAGDKDLARLQASMEVLGLQPFVSRSGVETATSKLIHESKTESSIHTWINRLETLIHTCFQASAQWMDIELPDDFKVDVFSDFGITLSAADDLRLLLDTTMSGFMDPETLLKEYKRRGVIDENLDVKDIIEAAESQLNLNNVGPSGNGGDPPGGRPLDRVDDGNPGE